MREQYKLLLMVLRDAISSTSLVEDYELRCLLANVRVQQAALEFAIAHPQLRAWILARIDVIAMGSLVREVLEELGDKSLETQRKCPFLVYSSNN